MITKEAKEKWQELYELCCEYNWENETHWDPKVQLKALQAGEQIYKVIMNLEGLGWDAERYYKVYRAFQTGNKEKLNLVDLILNPLNGYYEGWKISCKEAIYG